MDTDAVVTQIEALTVAPDEVLVLRFPDPGWAEDDWRVRINEVLQDGPLRNRFVLVFGDVEFTKVKRPGAEIIMSDIAE